MNSENVAESEMMPGTPASPYPVTSKIGFRIKTGTSPAEEHGVYTQNVRNTLRRVAGSSVAGSVQINLCSLSV